METVDNPGWFITIDLDETKWDHINLESNVMEKNGTDWYFYEIKEGKFKASGDPTKLEFLLVKFKEIIEQN